jgi:hypothetical protein
VNRYPATPAEFEALMQFLRPVDPERRPTIARMMFEDLGNCPARHEAVRRCDPRQLHCDRLRHLGCGGAT